MLILYVYGSCNLYDLEVKNKHVSIIKSTLL